MLRKYFRTETKNKNGLLSRYESRLFLPNFVKEEKNDVELIFFFEEETIYVYERIQANLMENDCFRFLAGTKFNLRTIRQYNLVALLLDSYFID